MLARIAAFELRQQLRGHVFWVVTAISLAMVLGSVGVDALRVGVHPAGLRNGADYDYELPMATMNRSLTGVETVFLPGEPSLLHVSSSLVMEVAALGGDVASFVPDPVLRAIERR